MDIPFQFLTENEFFPAPSGNGGSINSQPGYGTFASQNVTQTPSSFHSATNNKSLGSTSDSTNGTEQSGSLQKDLNAIYSKKQVPSADEIVCGIKAEMAKQLTKNKAAAKAEVLKNLKKDPKYYSSLQQLNIDDDSMMNESNNANKFWWMDKHGKLYSVPQNGHGEWARIYLRNKKIDFKDGQNIYFIMFDLGFVRIGLAGGVIEYNYSGSLPNIQKKRIKDLGIENGAITMKDETTKQEISIDETTMNEITQQDLNANHPKNPSIYDKLNGWNISKLTLDNLKALRDKMIRLRKAEKSKPDADANHIAWLDSQINKYNSEIESRLNYINKPVMENKQQSQKEATKKILDDLLESKNNKYVVNSGIIEAMRQTKEAKDRRSQWKQGRID